MFAPVEDSDDDLFMQDKPSYFDKYELIELDSEDEQAVGENNYVEIEAMSLNRDNRPRSVHQVEEEKKEEAEEQLPKKKVEVYSARVTQKPESKLIPTVQSDEC